MPIYEELKLKREGERGEREFIYRKSVM